MRILLDTHAIVWWATGDKRLSRRARVAIADPNTEVFISIASAWEIQIKATLQKITLSESVDALYRSLIIDQDFRMIGIELRDIDHLSKLPPHHRDPFDRMLVAQALRGDFTLVTKDRVVSSYGTPTFW
ncbi:MAG: type II toxin-antitoxin system VapC family toxin [Deltaproteobacteria bacterium]|nr:type II toxin-antitoxin system VapC family toxin [Deltaproteobacteria bacterium]